LTKHKSQLDAKIAGMLALPRSSKEITRRLYLYDATHAFTNDRERGFDILNEICNHLRVPFSTVRVGGSGQLGYSYFKSHDFSPTVSDLDIAIISSNLFEAYSEYAYRVTKRYTDLTKFPRVRGVSTARAFRDYLSTGFFRPDLMPNCEERDKWFSFFGQLSNKHVAHFTSINAGIYLSERLFELRNATTISEYQKAKQ
jgi:hypothetical protein